MTTTTHTTRNQPTPAQTNKLFELLLSSEFSSDEYKRTIAWLPNANRDQVSRAIDRALDRLKARKQRQDDAERRQQATPRHQRIP